MSFPSSFSNSPQFYSYPAPPPYSSFSNSPQFYPYPAPPPYSSFYRQPISYERVYTPDFSSPAEPYFTAARLESFFHPPQHWFENELTSLPPHLVEDWLRQRAPGSFLVIRNPHDFDETNPYLICVRKTNRIGYGSIRVNGMVDIEGNIFRNREEFNYYLNYFE